MKYLKSIPMIFAAVFISSFVCLTVLSYPAPRAFAASLGPGQCLQSDPSDCQDEASHGGNPNAKGAAGASTPAQGAACDSFDKLGSGISCAQSENGSAGQSAIGKIAGNIINVLSIVVGFIAVILIIVAGLRYATSGGDPNGAGAAKSALVGAVIGLAVAALAQVLVHFVLNQTNG